MALSLGEIAVLQEHNNDIYIWMFKIGHKRWANTRFEGKRYGVLTRGRSESVSGIPICSFNDTEVQGSHFHKRSTLAETWEFRLTLKACASIESAWRKACSSDVMPIETA